jgi:antitoxin CptB
MRPALMDAEAGRLLWRCRRGMKELDVLLERYVRSRLVDASRQDRDCLARLLELPDPVLADYLLGHATADDPGLRDLVAAVRTWAPAAGDGAGVRQSSREL